MQRVSIKAEIIESDCAVIRVSGAIVANLGGTDIVEVAAGVMEKLSSPRLIIDLGNVRYLDSYSFGWISKTHQKAVEQGGKLALCNANNDIMYLFELTNFIKAVPVYATESDAREALLSGNEDKRILPD